ERHRSVSFGSGQRRPLYPVTRRTDARSLDSHRLFIHASLQLTRRWRARERSRRSVSRPPATRTLRPMDLTRRELLTRAPGLAGVAGAASVLGRAGLARAATAL